MRFYYRAEQNCKRQKEGSLRSLTPGKWRKKLVEMMVLGNAKSKINYELGNSYNVILQT